LGMTLHREAIRIFFWGSMPTLFKSNIRINRMNLMFGS
jgi:hypothetical protein